MREDIFDDDELAGKLGSDSIGELRATWAERFVSVGILNCLILILKEMLEANQRLSGTPDYTKIKAE